MKFQLFITILILIEIICPSWGLQNSNWNETIQWSTDYCEYKTQQHKLYNDLYSNGIHFLGKDAEEQSTLTGCANVRIPLQWDHPENNRSIQGYIQKYERTVGSNKPKTQLWLLSGGPGNAGSNLYSYAELLIRHFDKTDELNPIIYVPDHRGTGYSTYLMCDNWIDVNGNMMNVQLLSGTLEQQEACWENILSQYSKSELKGFSTSNSARDVLFYMQQERIHANNITVYGLSYGTYWLNRILTLAPQNSVVIESAIADSVMSPKFNAFDINFGYDEAFSTFASKCNSSSHCFKYFPFTSFEHMMDTVYEKIEKHFCIPMDLIDVKLFVDYAIIFNDLRRIIFALLFRYNRCSHTDKLFLEDVNSYIKSIFHPEERSTIPAKQALPDIQRAQNNNLLFFIALSELSNQTHIKPKDFWLGRFESIPPYGNSLMSLNFLQSYNLINQSLYQEPLKGQFANFNGKMLILHCDTDAQTPLSMGLEWFHHFENATHILYPNCVHGAIGSTLYTHDSKKLLPTAGLDHLVQFLTGQSIQFDDIQLLFDYHMQFDTPFNPKLLEPIFEKMGCVSLFGDCPLSILNILLIVLAVCIITLMCIIIIITPLMCLVGILRLKSTKNRRQGFAPLH